MSAGPLVLGVNEAMQSSIERISPVECRVKVEIPWTDVSGRLDNKMRDLQRRARLPGFRPGRVPPKVLERMFGKSVREEVASDLVQETFQTAVTQHDTMPLTQPVVESSNLESGQPFMYAARFEVLPQIEPKDYTGVAVRRRPAVVDQSKIDAELEQHRTKLTEFRPVPEDATQEPTVPGDVWTVDIEGTLGEQRLSRKDVQVEIGAESNEFIPGLSKAFEGLGLKRSDAGSTRQLSFEPPAERLREEFRGASANLTLGLRDVKVKHIPELDDDFARDTGEAESLKELYQKIEDRVRQEDAEQAEHEARRRLVEALLERNSFEPAPSMVAREVAAQVDATKRQLSQQGLNLGRLGMNEAQLAGRIRPQALFNVKAFLLLDAIGKTENIDVNDEAVEAELNEMAEENGQNVARLRAQMEKNGQLVLMRAQMREEKILDFLMSKAEVTEAPDPAPEPDEAEAAAEPAPAQE